MIETHVVNALLRPDLKDEVFFKVLTFINGLVAPSFLFCAGFALAIIFQRKWEDYMSLRKPLWRYLYRLLFIIVVGYSLHLPFFSLTRLRSITDDRLWISFYQVDTLQTIAVTLILLVLLAIVIRRRNYFIGAAIFIAMGLIFTAPVVRDMDYSVSAVWLRSFLTTQFKSQFPLFPWSAFLIGGTIFGYWFLAAKETGSQKKYIKNVTYLAVAAIIISLVAELQPITFYPNHNFWRASPEFFFVRFGLVLLFMVLLWWYEQKRKVRAISVFTLFGRESLLVYVVHLLIVYGYTYEWSFVRYFGPTLNYFSSFVLFIGLIAGMYLMAFVWDRLKVWNMKAAKIVEVVVLSAIVLMFLLKTT